MRRPLTNSFLLWSICALWVLGLCSHGCSSNPDATRTPDASTGVMNFADTTHGVRLTYPGDWEERTFIRPRGTIVLLEIPNKQAGKMPPTFSLVAQDADESVSAADLPEMEQRLIEKGQKQIGDFHVVERSDTTLGGEPARLVIYSGRKFGISLQVMNIITTHAGRGYAAAYMADPQAFDEGRAEVDKVVQSVEFTR